MPKQGFWPPNRQGIMAFFSIILSLIGLGVLIFIHELGHYFMAKKVGMKVEAFSIGFGPAIVKWKKGDVEWRLCWLPFGGYVKIAGMQKENNVEPHEIKGGYFASSPWSRIKVSFMGPFANFLLAFLLFSILWIFGGREQPFSLFTKKIGWVEPSSSLYESNLRPGDEILAVNGKEIKGYQDYIVKLFTGGRSVEVAGNKIDYTEEKKSPFAYTINFSEEAKNLENGEKLKLIFPANYFIYKGPGEGIDPSIASSGIQKNDRLVWLNGEYLFSTLQLKTLLNERAVFLTVERKGNIFHSKIPKVKIEDLSLSKWDREELDDWRHEADLKLPLQELYFLPYLLNVDNEVSSRINFIEEKDQKRAFLVCERCPYFHPLQKGDRILAVNGVEIENSFELLTNLQNKTLLAIVQREPSLGKIISWKEADQNFDHLTSIEEVEKIVSMIGTISEKREAKSFLLLRPFDAQNYFSKEELSLGVYLTDRKVQYNPNPFMSFSNIFKETYNTLYALFGGHVSAKNMSGPVGIIQVIHFSWMQGIKEALFWLALISVNLGVLNLLPIPVLDGGHILFSLYEMISKRRIKSKTMERLIVPFVVILFTFILYVTYHDLLRLFKGFF